MRLFGMIMVMLLIQAGIMIFDGLILDETTTTPDQNLLNPYNMNNQSINDTSNSVWSFVTNPSGWSASDLILMLITTLGITSAVIVGLYVATQSDILLILAFFIWLVGLGSIPVGSLYIFVTREASFYACPIIGQGCTVASLAGMFTAGVLGLFWVFSCLEWWLNRSST